jgi:glycosyltransferase involved in cell wall biosynthesis
MNTNLTKPQLLTIICPVYNEEQAVPLFFDRVKPIIDELSLRYNVDLLFLNNASTDNTYSIIENLRKEHHFIYIITLSANSGYQRSIECGLRYAKGNVIVFIDVDCEDPPEMILEFVKYYEHGYEVVYGERVDREELNVIKLLRKFFYHIVKWVADEDVILYMAEFCLITSEVRDAVLNDQNSFPFIRSSIARVGYTRIGIPYKRHQRIAGVTHYNLVNMIVFAVAGILSSSTLPLRMPLYFFPFWLVLTGIFGALQIMTSNPWFLLINVLLACAYLGGTIAFIALYVARTYKNGLGRPNYVIHAKYTHMQPD